MGAELKVVISKCKTRPLGAADFLHGEPPQRGLSSLDEEALESFEPNSSQRASAVQ